MIVLQSKMFFFRRENNANSAIVGIIIGRMHLGEQEAVVCLLFNCFLTYGNHFLGGEKVLLFSFQSIGLQFIISAVHMISL